MKRVLVAALTLTILLCSCGSGSSGSSAQSPASGASEAGAASAPQAEVSSDEKIEIGYMTWNGGAQQKGEEAFFEEYEASHPNITIAAQFIQYDNYYSKLNTLIAASSCPDIFFTSESNLIDYAEKGMALDLNELFQKDGVSMKDTFAEGCYYESADGKICRSPTAYRPSSCSTTRPSSPSWVPSRPPWMWRSPGPSSSSGRRR